MELTPAQVERKVCEEEEQIEQRAHREGFHTCSGRYYWKKVGCSVDWDSKNVVVPLMKKVSAFPFKTASFVSASLFHNKLQFLRFIKSPFVSRVAHLSLSFNSNFPDAYKRYHRRVMKIIPNVTQSLTLSRCNLNKKQFRKIIQMGRHLERIEIISHSIKLDGLKLNENLIYSLQRIHFGFIQITNPNHKKSCEESILDFIKAASSTTLKTSLESIDVLEKPFQAHLHEYAKTLGFLFQKRTPFSIPHTLSFL
ncbi:unnamed protein product [Moneuplotes crassus]|uniref:Uncharacterized protein n=1 Tax=Euplotes crassus TaxID=5936 RepID=A0AAD1XTS1_EUPCR|nr:unnamed protein product [Moneuplotes crassus]